MLNLPEPNYGEHDFEVLGGSFKPSQWEVFLKSWQWPDEPRWGIWEYFSSFDMNEGVLPSSEQFTALDRAELFGESGHLSTRRDEDRVFWHFIGRPRKNFPAIHGAERYWETHPGEKFRREQKTALLWGEKKGDAWQEDRVGWANLRYSGVDGNRIQVNYWQFTRAGQVAFVWITGLHPVKEG